MIIIKGEINDDASQYNYNKQTNRIDVTFLSGNIYHYGYNSVRILENPVELNLKDYKFTNLNGYVFNNITKCLQFNDGDIAYYRMFYNNGTIKSYKSSELNIDKNILENKTISSLFDYYKRVSEITGIPDENGTNTLTSKYEKNSFISENTVLAKYLKSEQNSYKKADNNTVIFPFGCNLSQIVAVKNALHNQVSVIEGPPGTGKTQTILNIIANLIVNGNTVAVVSNNNDATENVFEKLQKYGFEYVVAQLGNSENKKRFISEKHVAYPVFNSDIIADEELSFFIREVQSLEEDLIEMLKNKNAIAELKQQLTILLVEKNYFDEYFFSTYKENQIFKNTDILTSNIILGLWNDCQLIAEQGKRINLFQKIKFFFKYKINSFLLFKDEIINLIPQFKRLFYELKKTEIEKEISLLESKLSQFSFDEKMQELTEKSMALLKYSLAKKYSSQLRKLFTEEDLWKNGSAVLNEYPVVLSSTYSAITSLSGVVYDYVIVDEASQVDLATGVLSMACAKNIVIVGDLKQLPNVITDKVRREITQISNKFNIQHKYRQEEQSLLSSICEVFYVSPRTLLREHYRCHPKIIEFCNQKFYNNQLIIMTEDKGEQDVLKVYVTTEGNHARGHINQRQIDVIKEEVIPKLNSNDYGIITPYRDQTAELSKQIDNDIPISTVHKFQGRENNDIIITTVDNEISEFTDNKNMLNVAVSRAKNRLRLVISDSEKNEKTNIGDLVKYIQYNDFKVKKSDVFSVFDMLYKCFEKERKQFLKNKKKISEYDSENIMYSVIEKILQEECFLKLDVVVHQPLNSIINNPCRLNDDETKYVMNEWSHVDFLIFDRMDKSIMMAIEVDGYEFHKFGTKQNQRDMLKDNILARYEIPLVRFKTTGSNEENILREKLTGLIRG